MWNSEAPNIASGRKPWFDHPIVCKLALIACFAFMLWIMAGRPWF